MGVEKSLRIKKIYFEQIRSGTKLNEYRSVKTFYKRFFRDRIDFIHFHYQQSARLKCKVRDIRVVRTPSALREFFNCEKTVYRVRLERPRFYIAK